MSAHPIVTCTFLVAGRDVVLELNSYHVPRVGDRVELPVGKEVIIGDVTGVTWHAGGARIEVLPDGD